MAKRTIIEFIRTESGAGVLLFIAALVALVWDNSPLSPYYHAWLTMPFAVHLGKLSLSKPVLLWVNDGLMTLFFLLVGLEVKRELFEGELNSLHKATLPAIAAIGGMVVPTIIYFVFNAKHPEFHDGWAIPTATDIAFSLGILALLGSRIPTTLKVFLTALAIFDDMGAIMIIALFYTEHVSFPLLVAAIVLTLVLLLLNRFKVMVKWPYLLIGAIMWLCVVKSGVHATLVGIIVAFAIPLRNPLSNVEEHKHMPLAKSSPARDLEKRIHPWIAYGVLPIFALANAGVSFSGFTHTMLFSSLPLGICLGLFIGKQVGIFGFSWLAIKMRLAALPYRCQLNHIYGIALIAGVGFTMSLFIGTLAFSEEHLSLVRIGVLAGSVLSGISGYLILRFSTKRSEQD